jgi:cytidylate kinase
VSGTPHPGGGTGPSGPFVIAIDGPAGTGKSTVARRVAQALTAGYLDTGAMYRIVTLAVLDAGVDPDDPDAVAELLPRLGFETPVNPGMQYHRLGDRDVTTEIRGAAVTLAVTPVSANPAVRAYLLDRQQVLAHSGRMVVEGRDIGTVVVPDATLKIYLTADAGERARRRHQQMAGSRARSEPAGNVAASGAAALPSGAVVPSGAAALASGAAALPSGAAGSGSAAVAGSGSAAGISGPAAGATHTADHAADLAAVARDLHRRDTKDSTRAHAPLQAAADAVVIDSSTLAVDETVSRILALAKERGVR